MAWDADDDDDADELEAERRARAMEVSDEIRWRSLRRRPEASRPTPFSVLLQAYLVRSGLAGEMQDMTLLGKWNEVVGDVLAKQVQLVDVDDGILVLSTTNSGWRTEVNFQKKAILARSNEVLGTNRIRGIRFADSASRRWTRPR